MHRLTTHPTPASHIGHRLAIIDDLHHCSKTLFHKPKLHKHGGLPPKIGDITATTREGSAPLGKPDTCNTATGTTVTQQPELVPKLSPTYRSQHVNNEPGQHRQGFDTKANETFYRPQQRPGTVEIPGLRISGGGRI